MPSAPLIFSTTTPVRTPINTRSESLSEDLRESALALPLAGHPFDAIFSKQLVPAALTWKNGYGSLESDAIPETFQPLLKRVIQFDDNSPIMKEIQKFTLTRGLTLSCAELYCFDNTLGLLRIDFSLASTIIDSAVVQKLDLKTIDQTLSDIAQSIYQQVIYPNFTDQSYQQHDSLLLDHSVGGAKDIIYSELDFSNQYNPKHLLWTGRCLQVCSTDLSIDHKNEFLKWANCSGNGFFNAGESEVFIGSGNYIVFANNLDATVKDVFRATAISQIYFAFMSIYDGVFKNTLSDFLKLEQKKGFKAKQTDRLLTQTGLRLELLTFLKLDFAEAVRSIQGYRKIFVDNFILSWQITELEITTSQRADFIRSRLKRISDERKIAQNRTIEMILVSIGGVAVVDFALSMASNANKLKDDDIWGLVDLFRWLTPDVSLWSACFLVFIAIISVYYGKK